MEEALDKGINQFDTANLYSKGDAEIVLGKSIQNKRKKMIISSKTGFQMSENPNDGGQVALI